MSFVSRVGGYDRSIYLWSFNHHEATSGAKTKRLDVFHEAPVSAMAYRQISQLLVSSDSQRLYLTDLVKGHTSKPEPVSNAVTQIHVHPQDLNITILEVSLQGVGAVLSY